MRPAEFSPTMVELLETPDYFRDWLDAKEPTEIVGEDGSKRCPLARFLRSLYPEARCEVGRNHSWVAWGGPVELPEWASDFVFAADDLMATRVPRPHVNASEALDLLNESGNTTRS